MKGKLELSSLSNLLKRSFAAQAQAVQRSEPKSDLVKGELKQKVLPNGMLVASLENLSPAVRIGVYVRAGPRFETSKESGASHLIRYAAGMHTQNFTIFGITRNIEYSGGSLTASSTRDDMIYKLFGMRETIGDNFKYLADTITRPAFRFWQLDDYKYRLEVEIARAQADPQQVLMDELHRISFRGGLANPLFANLETVEHHDPEHLAEMLHHYHKRTFKSSRMAVIGLGVDQDQLIEKIDESFNFSEGAGPDIEKAKFNGGESRIIKDADKEKTYVVAATEGVGADNLKDVVTLSLFQNILSTGTHIKESFGANKLSQAAAKVAKAPFKVDTVNVNYADTGLFGFAVACHSNESGDIVKSVVNKMRETAKGIKEEELQVAKNQAKAAMWLSLDDPTNLLEFMANTGMNTKSVKTYEDMEKMIDGVTLKDVSSLATKIMKSKGVLVSVGNLDNMCYLEDLAA